MITEELISYITKQLKNGTPKDVIISRLIGAGWKFEDVKDGFANVDVYLEPISTPSSLSSEKVNNIETVNIKKDEPIIKEEEVKKPETAIVLDTKELPIIEKEPIQEKKSEIVSNLNSDISKVWIPKSVPVGDKVSNLENEVVNKQEVSNEPNIQNDLSTPVSKEIIDSFIHRENESSSPVSTLPKDNFVNKDISKIAMLSSYQSDMRSISGEKEKNISKPIKKKKHGWLFFILFIVIIAAIGFFAYSNGFIKLDNIKVLDNVVKKDPKAILLQSSDKLLSLNSYKSETNIELSSVAMRDILSGVLKEEDLNSAKEENLNINVLGIVNNNKDSVVSDNFITAKGSFIPDYITTDIKRSGQDLFVAFPDLKQFQDKFYPEASVVKINKDEINLLYPLLSKESSSRLALTDLYKIFSDGIISYIDNKVVSEYKNFLNNIEVSDNGVEVLRGINTNHYSIKTDNQSSKDLLALILKDLSAANIPENKKLELDAIIKIANISSFDVWVGDDNNIYQYSFKISFPLSSVLDVNGNESEGKDVSISWKTTFYDFDIQNNIFIPTEFKTLNTFSIDAKKSKIKNELVAFQEESKKLFAKENTYGTNASGNCVTPVPGSVFSADGHKEESKFNTNLISIVLKNILEDTGSRATCYSTPLGWSISVPILDDYGNGLPNVTKDNIKKTTYFCVDSNLVKQEVQSPVKGISCGPLSGSKTATSSGTPVAKQ